MTKTFTLATLLTVTTGRLLTPPKNGGNGIEDLYEILGWMTGDSPFTHQLGRFAEECKPWLMRWFPELSDHGNEESMKRLNHWLSLSGASGIHAWLAEIQLLDSRLKDTYEVERIPEDAHSPQDPIAELCNMIGKDKVIAIATS